MISLASEMTDGKGRHARGWLFFDAECNFCRRVAAELAVAMRRCGLAAAPLQDPRVAALLGLSQQELLRAIRFISSDGSQYCGADALLAVAREIWWLRPLAWLSGLPGMLPTLRAAYRYGARRWRCQSQLLQSSVAN
jgi:predicted DCC family thiol-disulfide oxidoreductase YuxK